VVSLNSTDLENTLSIPVEVNMRPDPPTVKITDPISRVIEVMLGKDIGAVIVLERDGHPVGIITEKDILERVVKTDRDVDMTLANEVMSEPLILVEADQATALALDLMRQNNIRRLGVLKHDLLVGIVTERRLLEGLFQEL
jgi:CBS domain-containing protein